MVGRCWHQLPRFHPGHQHQQSVRPSKRNWRGARRERADAAGASRDPLNRRPGSRQTTSTATSKQPPDHLHGNLRAAAPVLAAPVFAAACHASQPCLAVLASTVGAADSGLYFLSSDTVIEAPVPGSVFAFAEDAAADAGGHVPFSGGLACDGLFQFRASIVDVRALHAAADSHHQAGNVARCLRIGARGGLHLKDGRGLLANDLAAAGWATVSCGRAAPTAPTSPRGSTAASSAVPAYAPGMSRPCSRARGLYRSEAVDGAELPLIRFALLHAVASLPPSAVPEPGDSCAFTSRAGGAAASPPVPHSAATPPARRRCQPQQTCSPPGNLSTGPRAGGTALLSVTTTRVNHAVDLLLPALPAPHPRRHPQRLPRGARRHCVITGGRVKLSSTPLRDHRGPG